MILNEVHLSDPPSTTSPPPPLPLVLPYNPSPVSFPLCSTCSTSFFQHALLPGLSSLPSCFPQLSTHAYTSCVHVHTAQTSAPEWKHSFRLSGLEASCVSWLSRSIRFGTVELRDECTEAPRRCNRQNELTHWRKLHLRVGYISQLASLKPKGCSLLPFIPWRWWHWGPRIFIYLFIYFLKSMTSHEE